jgi:hypothetical protein
MDPERPVANGGYETVKSPQRQRAKKIRARGRYAQLPIAAVA